MEKPRKTSRLGRALVALAIVVLCAVVVAAVAVLRSASKTTTTVRPAAVAVTTTVPYQARPGPAGTKVLTEAIDPLTVAVPAGWMSPAADSLTLPTELARFAAGAPPLASLVQAESLLAERSAVRLFAYQPVAPRAFVSVISFSSPGVNVLTPSSVDDLIALARKKTSNVVVTGAKLPVGQVLKLDSSLVSQKQPVVIQDLILISGGRTMLVEMVAETNAAGTPPVFDQIAQSLRLG